MIALPSPSPTPDARAADIFARTRAAFVARAYPPTFRYAVRISGLRNGTWTGRSYQAFEHWPSGRIIARLVSDEEFANPTKPRGINFSVAGIGNAKTDQPDILGIPKLAPTYAFGLATAIPRRNPAVDNGSLRTIVSVSASARNYDVRLVAEESVDGTVCWHLRLRPLGNPGKYRLRDLWVEEKSYQTIRLRTDGNFTAKETGSGIWSVAYTQIDGSWYITSEVSNGPVDCADGVYDHIAVQFTNIAADPHEVLDFEVGGTTDETELVEPPQ